MSEKMRESLSALLDEEANELELQRVLGQIADDPELRATWVRYNLIHSVANGQAVAYRNLDVSARVRQAINGGSSAAGEAVQSRFKQNFLRPLTSLAVAASVTATVVIGGQQLAQLEASNDRAAVASSVSPVGLVNSLGATSVQASYGTRAVPVLQPASRTAYQELARQRMAKYLQEHAEHAALNSPNGLVPFARVPYIQE
jgi:sigma-E factor negative regulatory protein RseA